MTDNMFSVLSKAASCSTDGAKHELPTGTTVTLHIAHNGAAMSVSQVVSVILEEGIIQARNKKNELFVLALGDVYAASIVGEKDGSRSRKAGFLG